MEPDVHDDGLSEDAAFDFAEYLDDSAFENENCGICMDLVIDRGALDCCDHWFCFACIDNWATITNLCPLCKSEFQSITCIPVYDTIGNSKFEEESLSRDDDWCIQGKHNTLSFPSYYIDENAVICLDGDGCKIRSGLVTTDEDVTLDTSIACDSCDLWYHAFCVGFDPKDTSENSWLCPRCKTDDFSWKKSGVSTQKAIENGSYETTDMKSRVADAFSGKVFVSVADPGETAVVVSMFEGKQLAGASEDFTSKNLDVDRDQNHAPSSNVNVNIAETEMQLDENGGSLICNKDGTVDSCTPNNQENHERSFDISPGETSFESNANRQETSLSLFLSHDASFFSPGDPLGCSDLKTDSVDEASFKLHAPNGYSKMESNAAEKKLAKTEQKPSVKSSLSVNKIPSKEEIETCQSNTTVSGVKRKYRDKSSSDAQMNDYIEHKNVSAKSQLEIGIRRKKPKSEDHVNTTLKCHVDSSISSGSKEFSRPPALSKDNKLNSICGKEAIASDIMSLVKEDDCKSSKAEPHPSKLKIEGENVSGLRIKKIMRRVEDKESSMLLQKLQQEIRETIHHKSSMDLEKSDKLDSKLLSAFRAAIVRPQNEQIHRIGPSIIRAKKMMIQKGKIREKLTKKIYGTASGRRRHAWNRDWEIEFWKHRCISTQSGKVQTLQSVLDLLNKSSDSFSEVSKWKLGPEVETKNSILSRLYLADASVFPRKEDIEPLSLCAGSAALVKCEQESNLSNESPKANKSVHDNDKVKNSTPVSRTPSKGRVSSYSNAERKGNVPSSKGGAFCPKFQSKGPTGGSTTISVSSGSKGHANTAKETPDKSDDLRSDKRKWALEVLARKTAALNKDAAQGKQEDNSDLKGNYPLLAQLPADMRPVLAPIRHNKVPMSVRQAQLYRLTEHYLRKTNLPVMRRTADTELAVADAVNIEKDICNRSNSKLVYLNICSQALRLCTNNTRVATAETAASCTGLSSSGTSEQETKEPSSDSTETTCKDSEAVLKMAGLVSDSPPNSPYHPVKDPNDSVENVFDIDSHEDLDIYGDFEYDLGDDDYIDSSNMSNTWRESKLQLKDMDSKMKVVLSTIDCEKTQNALNSNDTKHLRNDLAINNHGEVGIIEALGDSLPLLKCYTDGGIGSSDLEVKIDAPCLSPEAHHGGRDEEPSLAECEELYGPEKEPLENENYDKLISDPNKSFKIEATAGRNETDQSSKTAGAVSEFVSGNYSENKIAETGNPCDSSAGKSSPIFSENALRKDAKSNSDKDIYLSVTKKVEAYVKEHIRPLCKSGVITAEQYRRAVAKTTEKVMKYHCKAKNASFLIKEGDKVKKLAEQYVEAAQKK